jgi:hypothetical protein
MYRNGYGHETKSIDRGNLKTFGIKEYFLIFVVWKLLQKN